MNIYFSIPAAPTLLTEVQLLHPSIKVRQATSAFARELALADTGDSKRSERCEFVFDTMFAYIIGDIGGDESRNPFFNSTYKDYFSVIASLIPVLRKRSTRQNIYLVEE